MSKFPMQNPQVGEVWRIVADGDGVTDKSREEWMEEALNTSELDLWFDAEVTEVKQQQVTFMTVKDAITKNIQVQWFAERIFHSKDELDKVPQAGDRWQVCAPPPENVVTEDPGTARLRVVCVSDSDFLKRVAVGRDDKGVEEDIPFEVFIKKVGRAEDGRDMGAANDASTKSAHTDVPMVAKSSVGEPQGCPGPGEVRSVAEAEKDDVSDAEAQKLIESAKSAKTLVRVMSRADLEADYVMVEYLDGVHAMADYLS